MTDIALHWNETTAQADWQIVNGTVSLGSDLQTAVILSLFTDRYAGPDFSGSDARGWWGDTFSPTPWGSRLWTLSRAEKSGKANLLLAARDYTNEALQWLVDDGVAASVSTATQYLSGDTMQIVPTITEPTGKTTTFRFSWAWAAVGNGVS